MKQEDVRKILEIGVMLSSEKDIRRLLDTALTKAMDLAHCDAGTLYLLEKDGLHFYIMRNDTMKTYQVSDGSADILPPVPLIRENVCAYALLEQKTVRIADVYESREFDFSGPVRYDRITGYRTRSMLAVPMHNREGENIGVIQLINALDAEGNVTEFDPEMSLVLESVASQTAVTIQNVRYTKAIRNLFDSFVKVMSTAIDARTPYNASHTRHMAECGDAFLDYLNGQAREMGLEKPFPQARKEEFLMSVWLHDIGKLVTPLEVMDKAARLSPLQYASVMHRAAMGKLYARLTAGAEGEHGGRADAGELDQAVEIIEKANTAGFLSDELLERLQSVKEMTVPDENGQFRPLLEPDEYAMLMIRKGTLSEQERKVMEGHVEMTEKFLSQITFSNDLVHVKEWASSHHELLNGSGYPHHLKDHEISMEVRILTILDIFDALVADDRPYKPGMPVEKALSILTAMAEKEGKLDPELVQQFIASRCWEKASYEFLKKDVR